MITFTAIIRFRENGVVKEWAIGAAETDNEETLREHLKRWRPEAEFVDWRIK